MSTIDVPYRIAVETLSKVDDSTKQNWLLPQNQFNEQVNNSLANGLTIGENTTSAIMTQNFSSGTQIIIKNPLQTVPIGVTPIAGNGANQYVESMFLTPQSDQNKVGITVNWQPNSYSGPCTFILWGG